MFFWLRNNIHNINVEKYACHNWLCIAMWNTAIIHNLRNRRLAVIILYVYFLKGQTIHTMFVSYNLKTFIITMIIKKNINFSSNSYFCQLISTKFLNSCRRFHLTIERMSTFVLKNCTLFAPLPNCPIYFNVASSCFHYIYEIIFICS